MPCPLCLTAGRRQPPDIAFLEQQQTTLRGSLLISLRATGRNGGELKVALLWPTRVAPNPALGLCRWGSALPLPLPLQWLEVPAQRADKGHLCKTRACPGPARTSGAPFVPRAPIAYLLEGRPPPALGRGLDASPAARLAGAPVNHGGRLQRAGPGLGQAAGARGAQPEACRVKGS